VIAAYELANKALDGITKGVTVMWNAVADAVDRVARGIVETLYK